MATTNDLLLDAFGRIGTSVHAALEGLTDEQLATPVAPEANTIAWLVWHLTRVQDDHLAAAFDVEQRWTAEGWADRFALPFEVGDIGYGHTSEQVAAVRADGALLLGYSAAVHEATVPLLEPLAADDLDRVVDRSYDPPVTLGVRLVSVLEDVLQHAGQAAFVRGLVERRR